MSAYAFVIGMYPDTTEGILPDPRIDGRIPETVAGTDVQVDNIRLKFLDLPEVEEWKEKHVRIAPGNEKETIFMSDLPEHFDGLKTDIVSELDKA